MKPTPFFFACSLAINAVLAGFLLVRPAPSANTLGSSTRTTEAIGGISSGTKQLLSEAGTEHLENLRDRLLAEGIPAATVEQIIEARLWSAHQARVEAADPIKKRPWWQQTETQLPGDDIKLERVREISREKFRAQMDRLFPGYTKTMPIPAVSFLAASKREAIQQMTADYEDLRAKLRAEAGSPYEFDEDRKKVSYLQDAEKEDLRALLTESEYREFSLRDLGNESSLKKKAALLNMSEHEFRGLLAISEWMAGQNEKFPHLRDPFAVASPEQLKEEELLNRERAKREVGLLGTERHTLYLRVEEPEYETISRYVARYELPAARITEYFELCDSAQEQARMLIAQDAPLEQRQQAIRALAKTVKSSLQTLAGSQSTEGLQLDQLIRQMEAAEW